MKKQKTKNKKIKKELNGVQRRIEKEERQKERKVEKKKKGRAIGGREKESDLTRLVGPNHVCLFTKMPWKLSFDNLKTPKMYFQFP